MADETFEEGLMALQSGDVEGAEKSFKECLDLFKLEKPTYAINTKTAKCFVKLAETSRAKGSLTEAIENCSCAVSRFQVKLELAASRGAQSNCASVRLLRMEKICARSFFQN